MTGIENRDLFTEKLRERLMSSGFQDSVASTVAKSILPVKKEGNTVIAECRNSFYLDTILKQRKKDLAALAKECWGKDVELLFRTEPDSTPAPVKRRSRHRSDAAPLINSLFDFATPAAATTTSRPPSQAQKTTRKSMHPAAPLLGGSVIEPNSDSRVTIQAKPNIDQISKSTGITPIPVFDEPELVDGDNTLRNNLIHEFTFSTFVRGQSNLVAFSACEAVTQNPGNLTNPVFIYGSTGLGKTHLLHSVGNEIQRFHPEWKIIYVTSGDFMIEHIASIRFNKQETFRNKYRQCDVLLVDDIQFLEKKENTQLEFFHTFNELYQRKKQIVITSDKYPKDIPNISDRLKSRFVEGLIAEVEPPSFEDRLAIVEAKSRMMGLRLTSEIINFISENVKANVREIQGVLNNLLMSQSMSGKTPTLDLAVNLLKRIVRQPTTILSIESIQRAVATNFNLRVADLLAPTRTQRLVLPRHIAMYLASEMLDCSTTEIAEAFAKKDHTTVLHAIAKVKQLLEKDVSTRATINEIRRRLDQNLE